MMAGGNSQSNFKQLGSNNHLAFEGQYNQGKNTAKAQKKKLFDSDSDNNDQEEDQQDHYNQNDQYEQDNRSNIVKKMFYKDEKPVQSQSRIPSVSAPNQEKEQVSEQMQALVDAKL